MSYTDEVTRKDWKSLDENALDSWADEFEVDADVVDEFLSDFDSDKDDINSHIYGVLHVGGSKYLSAVREYCDENNIDYENTDLVDGNEHEALNIYTNYLDSGFDTELSDLITLNPDEENIKKALEILGIEVLTKEDKEIKKIVDLDKELPLEIKIFDENNNEMVANHISANYYDASWNLLKEDLSDIRFTEIYFSKEENNTPLKLKDLTNLIEFYQNITFVVDYQDDNHEVQEVNFDISDEKITLNLTSNDIEIEEKASLYEVTFYQKWSQETLVVNNIFADNKEDAVNLLIALDNEEDVPEGLEDLEYSVRDLNDDSALAKLVANLDNATAPKVDSVDNKESDDSSKKLRRDR